MKPSNTIKKNESSCKCDIEMKNKETPFCEPAQRTESYVTGEQKGVDAVIR